MFRRFSIVGLCLGLLFFSFSLTPSLLPRNQLTQGVLGGFAFASGYGIGVLVGWILWAIELEVRRNKLLVRIGMGLLLALAVLAVASLWQWTEWQNAIRDVMALPDVERTLPIQVAFIALIPAAMLIGVGIFIVWWLRKVWGWLIRFLPTRAAFVLSLLIVMLITSVVVNGVLLRATLTAADRSFAELDALAGQFEEPPTDPTSSGSAASLIDWDTIGRDARPYVRSGPSAARIAELTGRPAITPLRTYVGLRSAATVEARAALALAELKRIGAFDRSLLVIIMPVGTGWIDPGGIDTVEMLHGGDVASVALQYSYLSSPLSLLVEPSVGAEAAQSLFAEVYGYWSTLPPDTRPELYLHGLSLGAYASQQSVSLFTILGNPPQGALWAGPPFASGLWRSATQSRDPGSPEWLPQMPEGSSVQFMNQDFALNKEGAWGPVRLAFLQNGSDPIVFFDTSIFYTPPEWLNPPRARDVSPRITWYPVVTGLQVALDMALSQSSPMGYGHNYAPEDYLDAWAAVTQAKGWDDEALEALRRVLRTIPPPPGVASLALQ